MKSLKLPKLVAAKLPEQRSSFKQKSGSHCKKSSRTCYDSSIMPEINTESLLALNARGLIPGPGEPPEAFAERADYCLRLHAHLSDELKTLLSGDGKGHADTLSPAIATVARKYQIAPDWIPLFFTNHRLPFWVGGCAWIFQLTEHTPTAALIQLRKAFERNKSYLGIYDRDELLRHELCHVGRMMFQEPKYEEVIAYRTSETGFRRFFGPLVQSSMESALFLLLLFVIVVFDVFLIALGRSDALSISLWLKALPLLLIAAACVRLWKRQRTFDGAVEQLEKCVSSGHAEQAAFRLTDREIDAFAKMSPEAIKEYAFENQKDELRWKVIWKAYFS